ncbi:MAG TPA: redoxin domain-containing protein, partial [Rhodocyclaceae bacterium]|nr:redoxin domain-containing protein [Rhodocyclaceae bacterium]
MLKNWKKWVLEALAIIAVVVAVQLWQSRGLPEGPAPVLAGALLDGRPASLAEALKEADGKPVLVAFWATWCPLCKAEDGNLQSIANDRPVLSVAMQSEGVTKHMRERGLSFAAIDDPDAALAAAWQVRGVPSHFIVDGKGNVRFRVVGYATE